MRAINEGLGTDLSLMNLRPKEIGALDEEGWYEYEDQMEHLCIRLAWKKAYGSGIPVRHCLSSIYGRHYVSFLRSSGIKPDPEDVAKAIDNLRSRHELLTCFGFFVEPEAQNIFDGSAGHIYPSATSILTPRMLGLDFGGLRGYSRCAHTLRRLRSMLAKSVHTDKRDEYAQNTIRFVARHSRNEHVDSVSPRLDYLIELAELAARAG